jgi:thiamine transporter
MSIQAGEKIPATKTLAISAILMALSVALGALTLFRMPQGGSVTPFSMLPIFLAAYYFGVGRGLLVGVGVGLLNLLLNPYIIHPVQVLLDYPLAFGALAIGGLLRHHKKIGMIIGYLLGVFCRYLVAVASGVIFFSAYAPENFNGLTWSLWYNLTYLGVEAVMTVVVLLLPTVRTALDKLGRQAVMPTRS